MRTINWVIRTGFAGAEHRGTFEVEDDTPEKEIEETLQELLNEYCTIDYTETKE